ncbi:TonB-dependent receptor [Sphingomonas morindae]|uniref:TonB-dependent receptor n=1 Tax=Sphingomonas morindae TaxID=1541170 RepID=A0ABY4XBJ7_9SPHN|nr:TonB-dependent receptor [Sphingomonas morindae]USI74075.1 TonB-dependent receptor [Sphingomonas morindae]
MAQSTGQQDFDQQSIIVTGTKNRQVGGITLPPTSRAKETLTKELIERHTPGQTIFDTINLLPGVSFQNNDAYGAAGGTLNIRGFDASRIAATWDGFPLNDTGNYALYSNQQADPEIIDQVTVSLGSSDVDSPTAAASGSTVNYATRNPTEDFHVQMIGSAGQFNMMRIFGVVDTGTFTAAGTRAFITASKETYNNPFNGIGRLNKFQTNAKIYQPIGSNGDFISLAGHYNENRNTFFGSAPLRNDLTVSPVNPTLRTVGTGSGNRFPMNSDEREYTVTPCRTPAGTPGVADAASSCGTAFDYRYNPSDTGNARLNSRFTLTDKLVLTFDAAYAYTLANGGGTATAYEGKRYVNTRAGSPLSGPGGLLGYLNSPTGGLSGAYLGGVDLNGDGDTLDSVTVSAPSTTNTNRVLANVGLRYSFTPEQVVRVGYSLDWGRHRQTGEITTLRPDGFATYPFPSQHALTDVNGNVLQKRDRLSYAILHQAYGEYRGQFLDNNRLTVTAGLRAPFFSRDLNQNCFTTSATGTVDCFSSDTASQAAYAAANPGIATPQHRVLHYNKVLPEAGLTFDLTPQVQLFGNYSKGMQVPGTDNLYQTFFYAPGTAGAFPKPETTDNFDAGVRYKSGRIQAQVDGWYTIFHNRLASSYDPILDVTIYRNLGTVHKYGVDGNISYAVVPQMLTAYVFGSYLKSKILNNVSLGRNADCSAVTSADFAVPTADNTLTAPSAAFTNCALTKGKRESGAPTYTFGGRVQGDLGPVSVGVDVKRTGPRYVNDQNLPILQTYSSGGRTLYYQVYGAKAPAYTLVNLDARFSLSKLGLSAFNDRTFLQLNIYNLFNKFYVGGVSGGTTPRTSIPFAQIGTPRTISGSISFGF